MLDNSSNSHQYFSRQLNNLMQILLVGMLINTSMDPQFSIQDQAWTLGLKVRGMWQKTNQHSNSWNLYMPKN